MKYLFFLFLLLFTSCAQMEDLKTTKAEKWKLLEDVYLFEDIASNKTYAELEKNLKWKSFFKSKEAMKEQKEWRATKIDFFLDYKEIIEASKTSSTYEVLESRKIESDIIDDLSNGMTVEYAENAINIYFPKEESNFRRMITFPIRENKSINFQGKEIGGNITPLELEILFSNIDYQIVYYDTPLSERAWDKIFFISIDYYNDFIARHGLKIEAISTTKERKKNEL